MHLVLLNFKEYILLHNDKLTYKSIQKQSLLKTFTSIF